jgi:hypothetical protein
MKPIQTVAGNAGSAQATVHLMITQGDTQSAEQVCAEIKFRETYIGPVLEGILREAQRHCILEWDKYQAFGAVHP